ncbi:unnamed protein product [Auanema sp. JU1783]|nr:unnamed protein product [Auanema sp. JU1783]
MYLLLTVVSLTIKLSTAAYCGESSIPYSFEILPDGQPILGCARPVCFGWNPSTGERASNDASFFSMGNHSDGFVRDTILHREPLPPSRDPQSLPRLTSICSHNYIGRCNPGQWAAGVLPVLNASASPLALQCCTYGPLEDTEDRGVATVQPGQIVIGGEGTTDDQFQYFDYIANMNKTIDENGNVAYEIDIRRMACYDYLNNPEPAADVPQQPPQPPQQFQQPPQQFQQPPQQFQPPPQQQVFQPAQPQPVAPPASGWTPVFIPDYYCFTDDTTVRVIDGTVKRMDELKLDEWVQVVSEGKEAAFARVIYWQHRVPSQDAYFQKITLINGDELKLTGKHFIYKTTCEYEGQKVEFKSLNETAVFAENVSEGDCLYHIPKSGNPIVTRVSKVEIVQQKGIYSPMTSVGNIVVNGVYASCNTIIESNTLQSTFFSYVDYFNNLYGKIFASSSEVRELPIGLETWVAMAEYVLPKNLMLY